MDEELNQSVDDDEDNGEDEDEEVGEDQSCGGSKNDGQQRSTTLEMLRQRVKTEYNKIASTYKTQKAKFVKEILVKNRAKLDEQLPKRFADCQETVPFEYASGDQSGSSATAPIAHSVKCSTRNCATNHTQSINVRLIKSSPALPAMFAWNHVQQNYAVDDEVVLSNIPYLGDDVKDSDVFIDDLLNHYDRGVHGNREEGAGFLNDQMFFDLANRLVAYVPETDQSGPNTSSFSSKIPPDVVFEAIGSIFTDKGTVNDLKAKYRDILYKSSGGTISSSEHCNPDIESPNAVSVTAEQTLHSFTTLFCRRCYKYDCYMHPCTLPPSKVRQKPDLKVEGPCGEKCSFWFLDNQDNSSDYTDSDNDAKRKRSKQHYSTSQGNSPLRSSSFDEASSNQSSDDCCGIFPPSSINHSKKKGPSSCLSGLTNVRRRRPARKFNLGQWTPAEESLFRAMATVFGENCCAIATALDTKSCQEVYAFAAKDRMNNPVSPEKPVTPGDERCFKYKRFRHKDWMRKYSKVAALKQIDGTLKVSTTSSYMPCSHDGYCNEQNCCCIGRSTFCEKFCHCPADCPNRFPGCRCKAHCDTKQCPCYLAVRECDPDLCPSCGAADFNPGEIIRCQNVNIQRGLKKRLLLAPSDVAGWGIFLKEPVEKNSFIAEYCGEIISQDEAERRGKVYDRHMCSFLFNLNQDLVVDATRKGNKIRFANHSVNPNCVAKVLMVNGDHRIGIFSRCAINADDELFFDYRYGPVEQLKFVGIEQKRKNSMPKP